MKVTFLGTASCYPTPQRGVSCTAVTLKDGQVWLFDAGEGSQIQLQKSQLKQGKITKIFVTHLHGDHSFGLPGLLCTLGNGTVFNPDDIHRAVTVYGPKGIRKMVNTALEISRSPLSFNLDVLELVPEPEQLPEDWAEWGTDFDYHGRSDLLQNRSCREVAATKTPSGDKYWEVFKSEECAYVVRAGILKHRIPCFGYVIREKNSPGNLDAKKLIGLGLKPGPEYGRLKAGEDVTTPDGTLVRAADVTGPTVPGRKLVVLGDTCNSDAMSHLCTDADLLLHEATMENANLDKALAYGHSTPDMAADFAVKTKARRLCLFHLSPRYRPSSSFGTAAATSEDAASLENDETGDKLRREAQAAIDRATPPSDCQVYVAEDFMVLEVPSKNSKK